MEAAKPHKRRGRLPKIEVVDLFCGIRINSRNPLTNYKLIDDIVLKLSNRLKVQNQQEALAEAWKPHMKNLDTLYTNDRCEFYKRVGF